jgi:hypothetical protein
LPTTAHRHCGSRTPENAAGVDAASVLTKLRTLPMMKSELTVAAIPDQSRLATQITQLVTFKRLRRSSTSQYTL